MVDIGWTFEAITPAGTSSLMYPRLGVTLSQDLSRDTRRTLSGIVLLPADAATVDLAADRCRVTMTVDGDTQPMGVFYFTEDSLQIDAVDDTGYGSNLVFTEAADAFTRLRAADERPRVALAGADPAAIMMDICTEVGLPHAITGAVSALTADTSWPAGTRLETILSQCADLAGHRRPWADNNGIIRSVAAAVVDTDVIPLTDLRPLAGSVLITNTRLSAPNRVVVVDDSAAFPTVGTWDAPSTAPNSTTARGWTQVEIVAQQGLAGAVHATAVAEAIGEQLSARRLAATITPTNLLDGPVVLSYLDAQWLVTGWSLATTLGATMSLDALELTG